MIHIEGLKKSFQDGDELHQVLGGVDLDIPAGDFVALVGRSGSGKSTLLHCLAGIEVADEGCVTIDGVDLSRLDESGRTRLRRDRIGIVFQFFHLLPSLTVRDNICLPALLAGEREADARTRCDELLEELEILDRAAQFPDRLSGGEQQRVAIARALINRPAVLLADEPTGNLDAETAEITLGLFQEIHTKHGVTILMVTHSDEAAAIARRRALLVEGRIEWAPEPADPEEASATDDERRATEESSPADETPADPDAPKITIPEEGPKEGVRPSAKAAALFGGGATAAGEPVEETSEEPDTEALLDEVVDEALTEDPSEKN